MDLRIAPPYKVLLINPPPVLAEKSPPLGLAALGAVLREEYETRILDLSLHWKKDIPSLLLDPIREEGFNVIGLTGQTFQIKNALRIASFIKEQCPQTFLIFGGVHSTFCPEEILSNPGVDLVVRYEGEGTIMEIMEHLDREQFEPEKILGISYRQDGEVRSTERRPLLDINTLPFPARDLLPMEEYTRIEGSTLHFPHIEVMFSRGCVGNCDFCSSPFFWRKFRFRTLDKIIAELEDIVRRYHVYRFSIVDDFFTADRELLVNFCRAVKPLRIKWGCMARVDYIYPELLERMREAGCYMVSYGVESGSQKILDKEHKGTKVEDIRRVFRIHRKARMPGCALIIVGHPYETAEDLEATYQLLRECRPFLVVPQFMAPFPGTRWGRGIAQRAGTIVNKDWDAYFCPQKPLFIPESLSEEILLKSFRKFQSLNGGFFTRFCRRLRIEKLLGRPRWHPKILYYTLLFGLTGKMVY